MRHCIQRSWNLKSYLLLKTQIINSRDWKDWCWSWNSNILATWCKELTHWNWLIPWCWERLRAGGEGGDRGLDGWMASPTRWTWVWVNSGSWWWTGRPGVLQSMEPQIWTWLSDWTGLKFSSTFHSRPRDGVPVEMFKAAHIFISAGTTYNSQDVKTT